MTGDRTSCPAGTQAAGSAIDSGGVYAGQIIDQHRRGEHASQRAERHIPSVHKMPIFSEFSRT